MFLSHFAIGGISEAKTLDSHQMLCQIAFIKY